MSLEKALETTKNGDIIVAVNNFSKDEVCRLEETLELRQTLRKNFLPLFFSGRNLSGDIYLCVFGISEKFSDKHYLENFKKKCSKFDKVDYVIL